LAIVELVARGLLRVVDVKQAGFLGQTHTSSVLARGDTGSPPPDGPLRSIMELTEQTEATTFPDGTSGIPVARLAAAAQARYGSLDRFVTEEVLLDLERRGLYARETSRILWLFPVTRWRLTPAGQQALAELQRLMALGDQRFSGWVDENPGQALAYTALAGSALLLMSDSYPDMQRLHTGVGAGDLFLNIDPVAFDSLTTSFGTMGGGSDGGGGDGDFGGADIGGGDGGGSDAGGGGSGC
jgi:uncharacterized membrane protein YgcG